jgi:GH15 family glucan-1,4-alpha-glucosidase
MRPDRFAGREGALVPVSWWAVAALAATGRVDEARERADALCTALPWLMAEEIDPLSGAALGNVPLVWSHIEAARALYILDAAQLRRRYGRAGLWAWRIGRYLRPRRGRR